MEDWHGKTVSLYKDNLPVVVQDIVRCGASGANPALVLSLVPQRKPAPLHARRVADDVYTLATNGFPVHAITVDPTDYANSYLVLRVTTDGSAVDEVHVTDRFRIIPTGNGTYELFAIWPGGTAAQPLHVRTEEVAPLCAAEGKACYKLIAVHPMNREEIFARGAFSIQPDRTPAQSQPRAPQAQAPTVASHTATAQRPDTKPKLGTVAWCFIGAGILFVIILVVWIALKASKNKKVGATQRGPPPTAPGPQPVGELPL